VQGNDSIQFATSILDYGPRVAVMLPGAFRPRHVDPSEVGGTTRSQGRGRRPACADFISRPDRSRPNKLSVVGSDRCKQAAGGSKSRPRRLSGQRNETQNIVTWRHRAKSESPEAKLSPASNWGTALPSPTPSRSRRAPRRSESQSYEGERVRRVSELHAGAQRHLHEVRQLRRETSGVRENISAHLRNYEGGSVMAGLEREALSTQKHVGIEK